MELSAGPFYTSSMFWTVAGPIIGIISIVATVWVTIRVAFPKRQLLYSIPIVTPMLNAAADMPTDIEVRRGDQVFKSPRLVYFRLSSKGRRDIPRSAFDDGQPIRFDIGTPIVECLKVETWPRDRVDPSMSIDGSTLLIHPSLMGKRQTTVFTLLVDGPEPSLGMPEQTLIDVELKHGTPDSPQANLLLELASDVVYAAIRIWTRDSSITPER